MHGSFFNFKVSCYYDDALLLSTYLFLPLTSTYPERTPDLASLFTFFPCCDAPPDGTPSEKDIEIGQRQNVQKTARENIFNNAF